MQIGNEIHIEDQIVIYWHSKYFKMTLANMQELISLANRFIDVQTMIQMYKVIRLLFILIEKGVKEDF